MWGYDSADDTSKKEQTIAAKRAFSFFAGLTAFVTAIMWYVPKDLFTTAAWLDQRELGMLYTHSAMAFAEGSMWDITNVTAPVTEEAFRFGVGVMLSSVLLGILFQTAGAYTKDRQCNSLFHFFVLLIGGKVSSRDVNWGKLSLFFFFLVVIMFDSYTDYQFSSKFGSAPKLDALFYSVIVYNIMSEFFLIRGLQLAIGNAPDALSGLVRAFIAIITSPFSGNKKKSQPQQKGVPNQTLPPRNNQQGKNKNRGGANMRQNGGRPVPAQPRFDPRDPRQNGMNHIVMPEMRLVDDEVDRD